MYGVKTIRLQTNHSRFPFLQQSKCITCLYKYILTHLYFPQNVTDALVVFPQPTTRVFPRFHQIFANMIPSSPPKSKPHYLLYPPSPPCWPAVDWKENANPATTRRHKQLVINTGPSPQSSKRPHLHPPSFIFLKDAIVASKFEGVGWRG